MSFRGTLTEQIDDTTEFLTKLSPPLSPFKHEQHLPPPPPLPLPPSEDSNTDSTTKSFGTTKPRRTSTTSGTPTPPALASTSTPSRHSRETVAMLLESTLESPVTRILPVEMFHMLLCRPRLLRLRRGLLTPRPVMLRDALDARTK